MPVTKLESTPSTNAQNVQYIIENLEEILSVTLGFNLEYDIADDDIVETTPGVILNYDGEVFEESFGEKPMYNEIPFSIMLKFKESDPKLIRSRAVTYAHQLREGITIDLLNVGALASSQIVSRVEHDPVTLTTSQPILQLDYNVIVRYREVSC